MAGQQIDIHPVPPDHPSDAIDPTANEDLGAGRHDPRHRQPIGAPTARVRRRVEAVALSAAALTWGMLTILSWVDADTEHRCTGDRDAGQLFCPRRVPEGLERAARR